MSDELLGTLIDGLKDNNWNVNEEDDAKKIEWGIQVLQEMKVNRAKRLKNEVLALDVLMKTLHDFRTGQCGKCSVEDVYRAIFEAQNYEWSTLEREIKYGDKWLDQ